MSLTSSPFSSAGAGAASAGSTSSPPLPFTPVIFCGPGSNLYPLCDAQFEQSRSRERSFGSSSAAHLRSAAATGGIKALLPVANRPLLAYPLQLLCTAGLDHALVVAHRSSHGAIAAALRACSLEAPASAQRSNQQHGGRVNIVVREWSSTAASSSAQTPTAASFGGDASAFRVELVPMGPNDNPSWPSKEDLEGTSDRRGLSHMPPHRWGPAQILLYLQERGRLQGTPLVLPCDLVSPAFPLAALLSAHMQASFPHAQAPAVTALLYERGAGEGVGREREKEAPPRSIYAYASPELLPRASSLPSVSRSSPSTDGAAPLPHSVHSLLLHLDEEHFASQSADVSVRMGLLSAHPRTRFATDLLDAHVYLVNMPVLAGLLSAHQARLKSLREHVVPTVAKCSWQKGMRAHIGWTLPEEAERSALRADRADKSAADEELEEDEEDAGSLAAFLKSTNARNLPSPGAAHEAASESEAAVKCVALIARLKSRAAAAAAPGGAAAAAGPGAASSVDKKKGGADASAFAHPGDADQVAGGRFMTRANTLPTYIESNRYVLKLLAGAGNVPPLPAQSAQAPSTPALPGGRSGSLDTTASEGPGDAANGAQVSADSLVGSSTRLGERTTVKRSVIGRDCTIGRSCRLQGCIIMDGCTVGEGAKLENTLLAPGSRVGERVTLKDCDVGPACSVKADTSSKNEKFVRELDDALESGEDGNSE